MNVSYSLPDRSEIRASFVLYPVDVIIFAYLLLVLGLTAICYGTLADAGTLLLLHLIAPPALLAILRSLERMPPSWGKICRVWYPYLITPLAYKEAGLLAVHLHSGASLDGWAVRAENLLFGGSPVLLLAPRPSTSLTGMLQIVYALYYLFPLAAGIGLWLYQRRRRTDHESIYRHMHFFSFVLCLGFYLSFLGYLLVPVKGPEFFLAARFGGPLLQPALTEKLRCWIALFQGDHRDCFPSAHVAVALLIAWLYLRERHRAGCLIVPYVTLLILSTVYLRYHYGVDVLGGAALAVLIACAAPRVFHGLSRSLASFPASRR